MKKVIKLTETDLTNIIKKVINEQKKWLSSFFGTAADDIIKNFGDDAAKTLDDVFKNAYSKGNLVNRGGNYFLKSMSGAEIPMSTIKEALSLVGQGKLSSSEVAKYLPRQLADGTEFRNLVVQTMEKKSAKVAKQLSSFESKHLLKNCFNNSYCDTKTIFNEFMTKIGNIAKLPKFEPSGVKILEKTNVSGREILNVQLPNGEKILFYKSTGSNVASTGKKAGEWYVIPGFAENGWFFKTKETIALTKGGNKYLTEFADYLYKNGSDVLKSSGDKVAQVVKDMFKGQRISNRWYGFTNPEYSKFIEWDKITNAKNMDDYNKIIAKAIKTNNYSHISSKGFEKFGINNFREYLQNNISKVNEVDPTTGRWSVIFK